jgi:hypothetical protein
VPIAGVRWIDAAAKSPPEGYELVMNTHASTAENSCRTPGPVDLQSVWLSRLPALPGQPLGPVQQRLFQMQSMCPWLAEAEISLAAVASTTAAQHS